MNYDRDLCRCLLLVGGAESGRLVAPTSHSVSETVSRSYDPGRADRSHGRVKLKNWLDAYPKMAEFLDKYLK